jgi:hypothetical protein
MAFGVDNVMEKRGVMQVSTTETRCVPCVNAKWMGGQDSRMGGQGEHR